MEAQPGPSRVLKRSAVSFADSENPLNMRQWTLMKKEQIDYLTIEERKVLSTACQVVPTVDPSYVFDLITKKSMSNVESIVEHLFGYEYPTIKQRVRRECVETSRKAFLCEDGQEFDCARFLEVYPDPEAFFDQKRQTDEVYMRHAMAFLSRKFGEYDVKFIKKLLLNSNKQLLPAYRILKEHVKAFAKDRNAPHFVTSSNLKVKFRRLSNSGKIPDYPDSLDELFFREAQFCLFEDEILACKASIAARRKKALEDAEREGLLKECIICCEDNYLEEDIIKCNYGDHEFCKNCVKQHAEAQIGEGSLQLLIMGRKGSKR
uniref:RING-type domain-containing protein n=1 Tax=Elaeophora elaphi TaxID=1147741 RepID=A0A0R3RPW8_9BILA